MKQQLEQFIREKVNHPKQEEIDEILNCFEPRTYQKGDFFKEPFTINKEFGFLISGAVRLIVYKESGDEVTARLLQENSFVADVFSIRTGEKTPVGIKCWEEVKMLVAPFAKIHPLLQTNLALNITMREYITERATEMGSNYMLFISGSAKERYQFILENNPKLVQKFPLRLIASLIGITPVQLSRIRNKISE